MGAWNIILPESGTNLVTNPSFELGTTGWSSSGGNTITRQPDRSVFGGYSLRATFQDTTTLANFKSLTLTAAAHVYTAYVFLPSNWDGGAVKLDVANFASATTDSASTSTTTTGEWVRLEMAFTPDAGDLTGWIQVVTAGAATAGRQIFIDGVQVEASSYKTTYIDGDRPGCAWDASEHGSTSTRIAYGVGGRVRDFEDDLSLPVETMQGLGMPPIANNFSALSLADGSQYESMRYLARELAISSSIEGTSLSNLHSTRQTLVKAFNPLVAPSNEPPPLRRLRYTGASVDKEIDVVYDAGLEFNNQRGFTDETSLRLIAPDPMFYGTIGANANLSVNDTPTVRVVAGRQDGVWDNLGPPHSSGTYTDVRAVLQDGDYVYFGGNFVNFDNVANADRIVRYSIPDGTWSAMGTGADGGRVNALAADAVGNAYAVGTFTNMGGLTAGDYVARWDGSSWNAMANPGANSTTITTIRGVAIRDGNVIVAGDFTDFDGVSNADYVAYWDGSSWNAMGAQTNEGYDVTVRDDGTIFAAFWNSGGSEATVETATGLTATWSQAGGAFNQFVRSLDVGPDSRVYAGGDFTTIGSLSITHIARYSGAARGSWADMGGGLGNTCRVVRVAPDGDVWVGGEFSTAGDVAAERIARFTDGAWQPVAFTPPGTPIVRGIDFQDKNVYIGFDTTGSAETAGSTDVAYAGTAKASPVVIIEVSGGTGLLHSITNEATGQTLSFDYTLQNGERLVIDTRRGSRGITSSDGSNQLSALTGGNLGAFKLVPPIGDAATRTNTIIVFISDSSGTPTYDVVAYWRDAYLSAD